MANAFTPFKVDVGLESERAFDTRQIHAGAKPDTATKARAVPNYATAPAVEVLEKRIAALEGGTAAVTCTSGQSAVFHTFMCLVRTGDSVVASTALYGGSYSLFKTLLPRMGVSVRWVSTDDAEAYRPLIDDRTKLVFVETVGNLVVSIPDLQGIADIANKHHVPFVVDNTFGAGGFWCPVVSFGADIVVYSATKWLGGHWTTIGGVVVVVCELCKQRRRCAAFYPFPLTHTVAVCGSITSIPWYCDDPETTVSQSQLPKHILHPLEKSISNEKYRTHRNGVVVDSGRFDWKKAGIRFPHLTQTSDGPMAFSFASNQERGSRALGLTVVGLQRWRLQNHGNTPVELNAHHHD